MIGHEQDKSVRFGVSNTRCVEQLLVIFVKR